MAVQRFWYISIDNGDECVSIGAGAEEACHYGLMKMLQFPAARRRKLIAMKKVRVSGAAFFRDSEGKVTAWHVDEEPPFGQRRVDALVWLMDQPRETLRRLITLLYRGNFPTKDRPELAHNMPFYKRAYRLKQVARSKVTTDFLEMAMMLRISTVVDISNQVPFGRYSSETEYKNLPDLIGHAEDGMRDEFIAVHAPNIGMEMAQRFALFPGYDFGRVRWDQAEALLQMAKAYGYNAEQMSFSELLTMWREGARGMEGRRVRRKLGIVDALKYYEMRPWPKRMKLYRYLQTLRKNTGKNR